MKQKVLESQKTWTRGTNIHIRTKWRLHQP